MDRPRRTSTLPAGKNWDTFERDRSRVKLRQRLQSLLYIYLVETSVNVLVFRMPGTAKSHAMCSLGHRLVAPGSSVLFIPA